MDWWCLGVITFFGYRARRELGRVILRWRTKRKDRDPISGRLGEHRDNRDHRAEFYGTHENQPTKAGDERISSGSRRNTAGRRFDHGYDHSHKSKIPKLG
jgi:hypothetical protein